MDETVIEKTPSPLEYFAYTLAFQTLMCGPVVFYSDYIHFIEGARIDEVSKFFNFNLICWWYIIFSQNNW